MLFHFVLLRRTGVEREPASLFGRLPLRGRWRRRARDERTAKLGSVQKEDAHGVPQGANAHHAAEEPVFPQEYRRAHAAHQPAPLLLAASGFAPVGRDGRAHHSALPRVGGDARVEREMDAVAHRTGDWQRPEQRV
eukprot:CAMPEP_0182832130 /NCGR_PEP_ID=MMETSP0006_2-20121128/19532_1 /TAXON_ID=97485 /ORGANISM="Prymnesium parvum, Strain Texoma1" /LENGTH=135 /DNA_ID=CAMNT_0024959919 /DNA_START=375 /DNA_END=779 /DNA_ORIENTATION=+